LHGGKVTAETTSINAIVCGEVGAGWQFSAANADRAMSSYQFRLVFYDLADAISSFVSFAI